MTARTTERDGHAPGLHAPAPRLLVPAAALSWGLQFAIFNSVIALILAGPLGASTVEVGVALAAYNASGFVSALVLPALADRRGRYLQVAMLSGLVALLLAVALGLAPSLWVAIMKTCPANCCWNGGHAWFSRRCWSRACRVG